MMTEVQVSTLSDYLGAIEKLKSYYPTGMIGNNPVAIRFLYRGLADKQYSLLPGVFRKQVDVIDEHPIINDKYLAWAKEKDLLRAFIHEASAHLPIPSNKLAEWLEYAQHYGVPTRLLDWSQNPLVALYFCCRDRGDKDGTVWLLHAKNYTKYVSKALGDRNDFGFKTAHMVIEELLEGETRYEYPILYTPYYVDARMSAQSSYFMAWGTKTEPLEEMLASENFKMQLPEKDTGIRVYGEHEVTALLFRFNVYADRKQPLLHELDTVGINERTLFPGLDGIGRYVERKYRFDYNEALNNR